MAFGQGQVSSEGASIKRYIGIASTSVLAVNPSKEELEKIYERTLENDLEYLGQAEVNGETVPFVRLDFIVKVDPEKYLDNNNQPVNLVTKMSLFLRKTFRLNKDNTKVQVIDKYGRTAWLTIEQAKAKEIPMYSNGPANIDKDYRPAYVGEEELTKFLIAYLNIPACQRYIDGKWVMNSPDRLSDSEARLEKINDYFKGDVSELRAVLSYQPNNKIKMLFGVRTTDDGRQYQTVYTRMFLRNSTGDYSRLAKDVAQTQAAGALSTSEFECTELHEYTVKSTDFSKSSETAGMTPEAVDNEFWNSVMS